MVGSDLHWPIHFLISMFEAIIYGCDDIPQYNDGWKAEDKKKR